VVGLTTLTAYAAPVVSQGLERPVISAIDARHDHVYFQAVAGDGSPLIRPRVAPIEEALGASRFGAPHLVGNAANILADRWPADAPPPYMVDPQAAPDIAWVAWLGAAVSPDTAPARPVYLRAPDAKPSKNPLHNASEPASS
jgi:tRNA threonylcarbamoyladenosine biosynthesis protein TsaB